MKALDPWEALWVPYDEETYAAVIDRVYRDDVVLDIGAGDLRLARRLAERCRRVYAVEMNAEVLRAGLSSLPDNLVPVCADARTWHFPAGVTVAILLMRHCRHFGLYVRKLQMAGCSRLLTNARWGWGVEEILLAQGAVPFRLASPGWYACRCGRVGFVAASAEDVSLESLGRVQEVIGCPDCGERAR
ncbi:MAG: methyltransferase domain-containing protein [Bacillota bacterium]